LLFIFFQDKLASQHTLIREIKTMRKLSKPFCVCENGLSFDSTTTEIGWM